MSKNKTAIIAGASRGIGKAIALDLAAQGYQLGLIATDKVRLQQVADEVKTECKIYPLDVSDQKAVENAVTDFVSAYGKVDILFNSAGISRLGGHNISFDDLNAMIDVNLKGAIYVLHAVVPHMIEKKSGYIFNVGSKGSRRTVPELAGYCASKYGLLGYSEALFKELLPYNIKVTSVCPAMTNTDMSANDKRIPDHADKLQVDDLVKTVNYLLSLGDSACVNEIFIHCKWHMTHGDCLQ